MLRWYSCLLDTCSCTSALLSLKRTVRMTVVRSVSTVTLKRLRRMVWAASDSTSISVKPLRAQYAT